MKREQERRQEVRWRWLEKCEHGVERRNWKETLGGGRGLLNGGGERGSERADRKSWRNFTMAERKVLEGSRKEGRSETEETTVRGTKVVDESLDGGCRERERERGSYSN